jgi:asparagine synthase (glutamine-hydrolysing)
MDALFSQTPLPPSSVALPMSSIAGIIDIHGSFTNLDERMYSLLDLMKHRGNGQGIGKTQSFLHCVLGWNYLHLDTTDTSFEVMANEDKTIFAVMDGRFFNYQQVVMDLTALGYHFLTHSHTEVLVHSYHAWSEKLVDHLDGMFAFIIYNLTTHAFLAARDHIGIKPLYYIQKGTTYFLASEMKALLTIGQNIKTLMPGHMLTHYGVYEYFQLTAQPLLQENETERIAHLREVLEAAIIKQLPSASQPVGVMFSGGLDSAIVLKTALRQQKNITAFSIGFKGSADIEVSSRFCRENGVRHEVISLTIEELIQDLAQCVSYCETFEAINVMDSCTVSQAYKRAQEMGIQMMLCGDGSDELLAGYDFFKTYPDPQYLMHYRLNNEYRTDLQRIDRSSMRYTVESSVPFLDKTFMLYAYSLPMSLKIRDGIDKWILRTAFQEVLPDYITNRPKVRMPDGTGLHHQLLNFASQQVTYIHPLILSQLNIDTSGAYFLEKYLDLGYAVPYDRYKKPALDYSPYGYFDFITKGESAT